MKQLLSGKEPRKAKAKYPYIGIRIDKELDRRYRRVSKVLRRRVSVLLRECMERHLPELEAQAALKPGERQNFFASRNGVSTY